MKEINEVIGAELEQTHRENHKHNNCRVAKNRTEQRKSAEEMQLEGSAHNFLDDDGDDDDDDDDDDQGSRFS